VVATSGKASDSANVIGVASGAADGTDRQDVEKPPAVQNGLTVGLVRSGTAAGRASVLAQDIQQANGGKKTWNLVVSTPAPNQDVTLSWPQLAALPRTYEVTITDNATGTRQQMRQSPSLKFNSGEGASRSFTITAEPVAGSGAFTLTMTTRAAGGRGASSIEVSSTQAASITVKIKGSNGQTVRTLAGRSASLGHTASFVWDNRDSKGSAVPAGTYIVEATGTTADGQPRKIAQPLTIVR
jgi:hypothetical protein